MLPFDRELMMEGELSGNSYITELLTETSPGLICVVAEEGCPFSPCPATGKVL